MADNGSVTATGLKELSAAIDRLPANVTAALRTNASNTAQRIRALARQLLFSLGVFGLEPRSKYTAGQPHLADSIRIVEDAAQKQFRVEPWTPWLPNLGLWIERGTSILRARPFMRPAGDAERGRYVNDGTRAAERAFSETVGKAAN